MRRHCPLLQSRLLLLLLHSLFPHLAPTFRRFWQTHDLFKAENELRLAASAASARSAVPPSHGALPFFIMCVLLGELLSPRVGLLDKTGKRMKEGGPIIFIPHPQTG